MNDRKFTTFLLAATVMLAPLAALAQTTGLAKNTTTDEINTSYKVGSGKSVEFKSGSTFKIASGATADIAAGAFEIADTSGLQGSLDGKASSSHTHTSADISDATSFTRTFLAAVDAAAARSTLGLGTLATQSGTFSGTHSGTSSGTNTGDQTITLSGDGGGSGTAAITFTLATVNSNTGSFGSSTAIPTFTVNGKGLITAASTSAVVAPAGTLTGSTLASGVTASSLTSVGTLTGGATGAGFTVNFGASTVSGTLSAGNGGTGNAFTAFSGPSTSTKTFTLPNANATILTSLDIGTSTGTVMAGDDSRVAGHVAGEASVASSTTTNLGATSSEKVLITGTTTITSFGTASAGIVREGRFAGSLTLTHNATSLILPGGDSITTEAGDRFRAYSLGGGNWVVSSYTPASGWWIYLNGMKFSIRRNGDNMHLVYGDPASASSANIAFGQDGAIQFGGPTFNASFGSGIDITDDAGAYFISNGDGTLFVGADGALTLSDNGHQFTFPTLAGVLTAATATDAGATTGTQAVDNAAGVIRITPSGSCTFNATTGIAGARSTYVITTSGTTSYTITFGTNFKSTGTLATGTVSGKVFTVSFVFDGTNWCETSRTTAM